jgi:hypothetical protein
LDEMKQFVESNCDNSDQQADNAGEYNI